jgi:hypothetical protein
MDIDIQCGRKSDLATFSTIWKLGKEEGTAGKYNIHGFKNINILL